MPEIKSFQDVNRVIVDIVNQLRVLNSKITYLSNRKNLANIRRVNVIDSSDSIAINVASFDECYINSLEEATVFSIIGAPTLGQQLIIRIKDDGTARALTFSEHFRGSLPTTTVENQSMYLGFKWNEEDGVFDMVANSSIS